MGISKGVIRPFCLRAFFAACSPLRFGSSPEVIFIRSARRLILFFALLGLALAASAAVPDYKLGDIASGDVVTPVSLLALNPEATEVLRQKVSAQVAPIIRYTPQSAAEAEKELLETVATARTNFLAVLLSAQGGRAPVAEDVGTPAYLSTLEHFARDSTRDLPLSKLAPVWVSGVGENKILETFVAALRSVMMQPIIGSKTDTNLPANQSLRLVPVSGPDAAPSSQDLENGGTTIMSGKILSLWRARRLVETHFAAGQEPFGRFAAGFVRANAYPDPALTELLRTKRMEGVTVNDTYEAAQVIVRQGQVIDRRALSALTALRERNLIGTLQNKLELEQSVSSAVNRRTLWIVAGLGVICVLLLALLWRRPSRASTALVPVGAAAVDRGAWQSLPEGSDSAWRERALLAEGKAERAHAAIRSGFLGWMKEKIVQGLFQQRAQLLSAQQKAEAEMRELEQRLDQLHAPLRERIATYEKRIQELEQQLVAKGEENRELLGAQIAVARQQLNLERERGRFGSN